MTDIKKEGQLIKPKDEEDDEVTNKELKNAIYLLRYDLSVLMDKMDEMDKTERFRSRGYKKSLLDEIAIAALQGLLSQPNSDYGYEEVVGFAYQYAKKMLDEIDR